MVFPIVALSRAGRPIVDRSAAFRLGMAIRDSSRMIMPKRPTVMSERSTARGA